MIKTKNGKTTIKANNVPEMMADFTVVCKCVYEKLLEEGMEKEDAREFMQHNLELAFASPEELRKMMANKLKELFEKVAKEEEDHE